jgi:nitroreductase
MEVPLLEIGIEEAITGRRSVRAFRPDPVAAHVVEHILDVAARAPSGTNMQPWRAYALAGAAKDRLTADLLAAHAEQPGTYKAAYTYYPNPFFEPYLSRRRKVGFDLYRRLGIERGQTERMHRQHGRNLAFFDAPVGLIFTIDRRLEIGSWLDYGMFLQNIMVVARGHGLETCVQAAFAPYGAVIRQHLALGDEEIVVCGLSLGYEDRDAPENGLTTERVPARDFTTFIGFDPDRPADPSEPTSQK